MFTEGVAPLVVSPGDSLSSIGRERFRPNATFEHIDIEAKRIVELPGQELAKRGAWFLVNRRRSKRRCPDQGPSGFTATPKPDGPRHLKEGE
jgi:hypothetical protein